jgi:phenol 2-monooxygenase (NADPH)
VKDRIFLCGDAAHTHSSGAAQGLNTGIHDAVNLAWKLALQIRGITRPDVLRTYEPERISAVQKLINYDKDISLLMSRKWPSWYMGDPDADPNIVLGEVFEKAATFNTGLGISYGPNVLNQSSPSQLNVIPGSRPPDVVLTSPATKENIRFQRVTLNSAKFWVVVFTGNTESTRPALLQLERDLEADQVLKTHKAIAWLTIIMDFSCSPYEGLGMKPFGNAYFDPSGSAHEKFGVDLEKGALVILRPDGLLACGGSLEGQWARNYFSDVLHI